MILPLLLAAQLASLSVPTAFVTTVTNTPIAVAFHVEPNLASVAYRWVAADVLSSPVTNWVDRIQGHAWTNGQSAVRPIASGAYITTDSGHWLTSSTPTIHATTAVGLIINMIEPAAGTHPGIWLGPGGVACDSTYLGFGLDSDGGDDYGLRPFMGCGASTLLLGPRYGSLTNIVHNVVVIQTATNMACYTNSQFSGTIAPDTAWTADPPRVLGRNLGRATGPTMRIYEMWIWTNSFPASFVTNFHNYASSVYTP